jgi:PAS domain S-box-containing protein
MNGLDSARLNAENEELRQRLQELEDTLHSIHSGDVDALIVNNEIYTLESAHAASNRMRQDVLSQMEDAVFAFDNNGHIIYMNNAAELRYGIASAAALGRTRGDVYAETVVSEGLEMPWGERRAGVVSVHHLADGSEIHVESIVSDLKDASGDTTGTLAVMRDVTRRWRADRRRDALARLSDRLRDADSSDTAGYEAARLLGETLHVSRAGYGTIDPEAETLHVVRDWTAPGVDSLAGTLPLRAYGSFVDTLKAGEPVTIDDVRRDPRTADAAAALEDRSARSFLNMPVVEQGRLVAVLFVNDARTRDWSADDLALLRDVAERARGVDGRLRSAAALRASEQRLREANENLEAMVDSRTRDLMVAEHALRQAQKMEAVGQLTGGIAHDFNNLLAGIGGSLQILLKRLQQQRFEGNERYISMGLDAVRRAAALTQRLLAFARRQTLDPKPTDVNRLIAGMEELIRRTVGPSVTLEVVGAGGLWPTRIDPSQLENSLLNLCINARDAMMPGGGRLTIETANKWLDDRAAAERELPPGQYISLCVTDTGSGMTSEVIKRVFDPFFTTKPLGQGTGLGLSMVYGFVRQSGGQVRIYSELDHGTTMCLYLPRFVGTAEDEAPRPDEAEIEEGEGQTILVIEDEATIRTLITEVLVEAGYRALSAPDGQAGLQVLQTGRRIDFLITDVGLPGGINGRQVADAARVSRPALKVLFITGYAENAAVGNGHLEPGMSVLTKPFEITELARKVREMMHA